MANNLLRYRAHLSGPPGSPWLFTQYFDPGASPGTAEGTEAGARVRAFFESIKGSIVSTATVTYDTGGDLIDPVTGNLVGSVGGTTPANTVGGAAGAALPWATQVVLRKFTAGIHNGRKVNGKSYVPGYTTAADTNGGPSSGTQTGLLTAANLLSTLIVTAITPVVWHRPQGGGGGQAYAVVAYSAPPYFGVLRSRRD